MRAPGREVPAAASAQAAVALIGHDCAAALEAVAAYLLDMPPSIGLEERRLALQAVLSLEHAGRSVRILETRRGRVLRFGGV
jgi:hypothetical protein